MKRNCFLCLILCAVLLLTACGEDGSARQAGVKPVAGEDLRVDGPGATIEIRYNENFYPFPGGYTVCDVARLENTLLFLGQRASHEIEIGDAAFYGADLALTEYTVEDSGRITIAEAKTITAGNADEAILCVTAGGDGYFYALSKTADETYTLTRYSTDGESADAMTLELPGDYIEDLYVTSGGVIALNDGFILYLAEWRQGLKAAIEAPNNSRFRGGSVNGDSIILPTMKGIFELDAATGELKGSDTRESDEESGIDYVSMADCQGLNGELISNPGHRFYAYDPGNDDWDLLLTLNSGLEIGPSCRLSENSFVIAVNAEAALITGLELLPYDEETGRSVVKVAYLGTGNYIEYAGIDLPQYEYQGMKYAGEEYDPEFQQDVDRFLVSMMAGEVPDLVIFLGDCLNTSSNAFEDLLPYIDRDMSRDEFLPNFIDAFSSGGELHTISSQVTIQCVFAREEDVGKGIGLTPADYTQILRNSEKYHALFEAYLSASQFLSIGISDMAASVFTDRENAEAHFDDPAFGELLTWCREMGGGVSDGNANFEDYPLSEILLKSENISSLVRLDALRQYFGDPIVPVGLPDGAEGFNYYIPADASFAIPSGSQNKEGAWAYIKEILSQDNQLMIGSSAYLPVNYAALIRKAEASLSEEGQRLLGELLERTKYASTYSDQGLRDIIVSGAQGYMSGERTLEDTIAVIQSRASIYMAQNYG